MLKSRFEIFIDTDIFLDHLTGTKKEESLLLKCLKIFDCYTSVINASEIFYGCAGNSQREKAKHSFYGTGVLGIPYKYSLRIGEVLKKIEERKLKNTYRDAVITAVCMETKLPFLTLNEKKYSQLSGIFKLKLISKECIIQNNSPEIIFKKAKIL